MRESMDAEQRGRMYQAYLGTAAQFYRPRFERFDRDGAKPGWNWPAFFITFFWMLYRRLWVPALLYYFVIPLAFLLLWLVLSLVGVPVFDAYLGTWLANLAFVFIVVPMYANVLVYRHTREKLEFAWRMAPSEDYAVGYAAGAGQTSNAWIAILIIPVLLAVLGILAAIAVPAYQDYTVRSQVAAANRPAAELAAKLADYADAHPAQPLNPALVGARKTVGTGSGTAELRIDADGVVTLKLTRGAQAGHTWTWRPELGETGWRWHCGPGDLAPRYLPKSCRE